jgi:hypothetical protein
MTHQRNHNDGRGVVHVRRSYKVITYNMYVVCTYVKCSVARIQECAFVRTSNVQYSTVQYSAVENVYSMYGKLNLHTSTGTLGNTEYLSVLRTVCTVQAVLPFLHDKHDTTLIFCCNQDNFRGRKGLQSEMADAVKLSERPRRRDEARHTYALSRHV